MIPLDVMSGGIHDGRVEIAEETAERRTSAEISKYKEKWYFIVCYGFLCSIYGQEYS